MIDLIPEPGFTDLVEAPKLIEVDGETVRHYEPMKGYGEPTLTRVLNRVYIAQDAAPRGNQNVIVVVRIHVVADQTVHRTRERAIEPIGQDGFDDRSFK